MLIVLASTQPSALASECAILVVLTLPIERVELDLELSDFSAFIRKLSVSNILDLHTIKLVCLDDCLVVFVKELKADC